ncbi:MAG: LytTR family DNA-binding domain-containing protein [Acidaminobacteraceae bacterium]
MGISSIIICEDDNSIREKIKTVIDTVLVSLNLKLEVLEFPSYARAERFICSTEYSDENLFVLDIELGYEKTGINLGREIRRVDSESKIIYLSSHIAKSFDVFKYNLDISDFIEKNTEFEEKLEKSLTKCICEAINDTEKRIIINSGSTMHSVRMSDIIYIETLNNSKKLRIVTDKKMVEFYGTLNEIIKELDDRFILAHRANIVNINSISELNLSYASTKILLNNGKSCLLSRTKIKDVKRIFENL